MHRFLEFSVLGILGVDIICVVCQMLLPRELVRISKNFKEIQKRKCKYCPWPRDRQDRTNLNVYVQSYYEAIESITFV